MSRVPTYACKSGCYSPKLCSHTLQTLKRRKVLTSAEVGSSTYVSMCFSPDSRLLLAQGGAPEWNLMLWLWEKAKVSSQVKMASSSNAMIYQCLFCPNESGLLSIVGKGVIRTLRSHDNVLKAGPQPLAKREPQDYLCHTWMLDGDREKLLLGCATGARAAVHTLTVCLHQIE